MSAENLSEFSIEKLIQLVDELDKSSASENSLKAQISQTYDEQSDIAFNVLNEFIFSGVYARNAFFNDKISEFEKKWSKLNDALFGKMYEKDETYHFLEKSIKPRSQVVITALNSLKRFAYKVNEKLKFHKKRVYLNESQKDNVASYIKWQGDHKSFFQVNLFIAEIDHFVEVTDFNSLSMLETIIELIPKFKKLVPEYHKVLHNKATFLRNKLFFRRVEEFYDSEKDPDIIVNSHDGNSLPLDINAFINNPDLSAYKEWNRYLVNHYEINKNNWDKEIDESLCDEELESLSVLELHKWIKASKDIHKNRIRISEIRDNIIKRLEEAKRKKKSFDIYALTICLSYSFNNEFSFLCESSNKSSIKEIQDFYTKIETNARLSRIRNYFYKEKLFRNKFVRIRNKFKADPSLNEALEECETPIKECLILYESIQDDLKWTKNSYNYIFQLPFEECFVTEKFGEKEIRVFVYSSITLPLKRHKLDKELGDEIQELRLMNAQIESLKIAQRGQNEVTALAEKLEKSQDTLLSKDWRYLEMISIFTAVVTFVAATIPGFKFITTGLEAIYFTMALGVSTSLFALVFYAVNRGHEALKSLKTPLLIGLIVALIFWIFLFIGSDSTCNPIYSKFKELNTPQDSTQVQVDTPTPPKSEGGVLTPQKGSISPASKK